MIVHAVLDDMLAVVANLGAPSLLPNYKQLLYDRGGIRFTKTGKIVVSMSHIFSCMSRNHAVGNGSGIGAREGGQGERGYRLDKELGSLMAAKVRTASTP